MRTLLFAILLLSATTNSFAQPQCAGPGRIPGSAQAVCGNLTFREDNVSNCQGPDLPNPTSGCGQVTTDNSRWYKFHCYAAGTLGFLITPASPADDYDWEIMDITGHAPNDVYTMELRVSLNLSGQPGITGCTTAGISDINCGGGAPGTQFNRLLNLVAGNDYLMMVNNWSSSGQPYIISFSGTAVLTNNQPPTITSVGIVGCDATKLKVTFSEDILCTSITPAGSEFTITAGTHVITGVVSDCNLPGANGAPSLVINLQSAIPAGNYQLNIADGTDLNTFENVCKIAMLPTSIPFSVPAPVIPVVNQVTYTGCAPTVLKVALNRPMLCSSVTPTGSEFSITPGNPFITSVQSLCSSGSPYTDTLNIVLQNPLTSGNYQLVINNGADANTLIDTCGTAIVTGYTFPFTINIVSTPPIIQSFTYDPCNRDRLVVNFDKPVACASLTASGSEFIFTPAGPVITSISSNCGMGNYTSQVTLFFQNNLPIAPLNVMVFNGSDGNTLSDTCFTFIPQGYSRPFTATLPPAPTFTSVQQDKQCGPKFLKVFYDHPIKCNTIIPSGGQFWVLGPSTVSVIAATGDVTCGTVGYTHWVLLELSAPIIIGGNYRVLIPNLGAPVVDTCNMPQQPFEQLPFTVAGSPSAIFTGNVNWGCVDDAIVLSHSGGNGINSWTWNFSDGSSASGQNVTKYFPVATPSVTVELTVSNGTCSDISTQTFTLGNVFNAAFTINQGDIFCINTPVDFTDASTGNITSYLWKFGDATQFNGQNPPTHIYTTTNTYNAQLIVTDNHGCFDTASKLLTVNTTAFIDFTGLRTQYCTGNIVSLTRKIANTIDSYTWDNGDGKTFTDKVDVNFSYATEGVYTITLTGNDRYCGISTVSKTIPVYEVPKVYLGRDTVLCQSERMLIGVVPNANYTYLWNTGASGPQIYTDIFTRDYSLTADNHGCRGNDVLTVKVLAACLIKVPGAFTPNGDGQNEELKALNADLAKEFSFRVYNRLGQLMFATNNPLEGWDGNFKGNKESTGTYVWTLVYIDPWTGKPVNEKGTSILLR